MKKPTKSFEIALSAIACAVAALSLTLASYVDFMLPTGYIFAVFALMVPLAKDFIWGDVLALIGAVLLASLFSLFGLFTVLLPFLIFFGWHPLINYLQLRFTKHKLLHGLWFLGKAAWFDGALLLIWFTLGKLLGMTEATWYPFVSRYLYLIVFVGGTAVFAAYDFLIFLCQRSVNRGVARIRR